MAAVENLMTPEPLTLDPSMTLRDAVEELTAAGVSGAPVVAGETLVGVISQTDILEMRADLPGVPVEEDRPRDPDRWSPAELETQTAEEDPANYFTQFWDDAGAEARTRMDRPDGPEWDELEQHQVSEVMTRQVVAVPRDADVREAARLMVDRGIHRVLVVDADRLQGILTTLDVVRAVADGRIG